MLGNAEEAKTIASANDTPDGWTYLGSGVSRRAYLSPSGVVYKVAITPYERQYNRWEYYASITMRNLPEYEWARKKVYIPEAEMYGDVIAMEYIPPSGRTDLSVYDLRESDKDLDHAIRILPLSTDLHNGNVEYLPDGRVAVFDLGFAKSPHVLKIPFEGVS
jgi:hypothetical protein